MPRLIMITVYSISEACAALAQRRGRTKPYTSTRLYQLIHTYRPGLEKAGSRFFLTEADLVLLAESVKKPGRPKNLDI